MKYKLICLVQVLSDAILTLLLSVIFKNINRELKFNTHCRFSEVLGHWFYFNEHEVITMGNYQAQIQSMKKYSQKQFI